MGIALERSPFGSWFSTSLFRGVPGKFPESTGVCPCLRAHRELIWFRQSTLNEVLCPAEFLGQFFLTTLPSVSSDTCVMCSLLILGTDLFRDWPFLGCSSCVSFATAANFRLFLLFLNVAIFRRENVQQ